MSDTVSFEESTLSTKFLEFLNSSKSNYAAVLTSKQLLLAAGFTQLSEADDWTGKLKAGGKYFMTRNQSTIIAFAIGEKYVPGKSGFVIAGAHTDSPCLVVKPISKVSASSYLQVGLECYGGGLWHTWFDRDLGLSGRVMVSETSGSVKKTVSRVVTINKPLLRIPNLAIHLNRAVNDEGFKFNKEDHLIPVIATEVKNTLQQPVASGIGNKHHAALLHVLAKELSCSPEDIEGFDLRLCEVQDAVLGGVNNEFIFGGRLDNLMMSWVCLRALIDASTSLVDQSQILMTALYDHEEIGSLSTQGADSSLTPDLVERIVSSFDGKYVNLAVTIQNSFVLSCDMAHAIHPNYRSKHEDNHRPLMHMGLVVKENINVRYASNTETALLVSKIATAHEIPVQDFVVRNDSLCGSTIGPILSSKLGIRTVDVGIPQLSMHSIREMAGTADLVHSTKLVYYFFKEFADVDKTIVTDDQ